MAQIMIRYSAVDAEDEDAYSKADGQDGRLALAARASVALLHHIITVQTY